MKLFNRITITKAERGLIFEDREFAGVLAPGVHKVWDARGRKRVDVVPVDRSLLVHKELDAILRSGALDDLVHVVDLKDSERALVWADGRLLAVLPTGWFAVWKVLNKIEVETFDISNPVFEHPKVETMLRSGIATAHLASRVVEAHEVGMLFRSGRLVGTLGPGVHVFWKDAPGIVVRSEDLRERTTDIAGQDIITADRVTLRLNAVVVWRLVDAVKAQSEVANVEQALYRHAQLALRATVGTRELDAVLADKDSVAGELLGALRPRGEAMGVRVESVGVRDVILPGDMRELLNRVTEAKKAAEANLIRRREETAEMRHQANTARLLENNPALVRLRELETLERVAAKTNLQVVLGDKGLAEQVMKLI